MKTALIFPGQGSQNVGMGKELYHAFPQAKAIFDEIDDALEFYLSKLMFEGPLEKLTLTIHAQPALMAVSIAAFSILKDQFNIEFDIVAGHSLGEYSALVAAEVLQLRTAVQLLRQRGQAMQEAVPLGQGAMAAILGLSVQDVQSALLKISPGYCAIANDNGAGQVVISGQVESVKEAMQHCLQKGAKKTILLPVSAPFHCTLMQPAAEKMAQALASVNFNNPKKSIIMNVTADFCQNPETIRQLLVQQVTAPVRWREIIEKMAAQGVNRFIEIGAGKVLTGLGKRMVPDAVHYSVATPQDFDLLNT